MIAAELVDFKGAVMKSALSIILVSLWLPAWAATPAEYISASKKMISDSMKDPESTKFRNIKMGRPYTVCGEVNSKNSYGGYVGFKRFFVIGAQVARIEDSGPLPEAFDATYAANCIPPFQYPKAPKAASSDEFHQESDADLKNSR